MMQRQTPGGQVPPRRSGQRGRGTPRRTGSRPAGARRTPVRRTTAPQPRRLTGRATVLLAVLIALALGYTYPVRLYLTQESDIARMERSQEEQRRRIGELSQQAALWQDPEYIKIQARKRFFMVYPGEVPLVVRDLTDAQGAPGATGTAPDAGANTPAAPWYDTLWSSIQAADATGPRS